MHFRRAVNCFSLRLPLNSNRGAWGWAKRGLAAVALSCALAQARHKQRSCSLDWGQGDSTGSQWVKHVSQYDFTWPVIFQKCGKYLHLFLRGWAGYRNVPGAKNGITISARRRHEFWHKYGSPCHGKPLMLFLSFVVLSLMRSVILLWCSRW